MSTELALAVILTLWLSPFLILACWFVIDHRRQHRDTLSPHVPLQAIREPNRFEQATWQAPVTELDAARMRRESREDWIA